MKWQLLGFLCATLSRVYTHPLEYAAPLNEEEKEIGSWMPIELPDVEVHYNESSIMEEEFLSRKIYPSEEHSVPLDYAAPLSEEEKEIASRMPIKMPDVEVPYNESSTMEQEFLSRNIYASIAHHWPNHIVPYVIDNFKPNERQIIAQAIARIESTTCLRWVPRKSSHKDYVHIIRGTSGSGCFADLGYSPGLGRHGLNLEPNGCIFLHNTLHEMLHILGFAHEQSRPDRDKYIKIHWDNIKPDKVDEFFKNLFEDTTMVRDCRRDGPPYDNCNENIVMSAYGLPYDFNSVMHYGRKTFARDRTMDTMTPKDASVKEFGSNDLSAYDIQKINNAYKCHGTKYGGCGGQQTGISGTVNGNSGHGECHWNLIGSDSSKILLLAFEEFNVPNCKDGYIIIGNGNNENNVQIGKYCGNNVPTVITSSGNQVYVKHVFTQTSYRFSMTWTSIDKPKCCSEIEVTASPQAYISKYPFYQNWLGKYKISPSEEGLVYRNVVKRKRKYFLSKVKLPPNYSTSYPFVMNHDPTEPGTSGFMQYGNSYAECAEQITTKKYYDQGTNQVTTENEDIQFTCTIKCESKKGPTKPDGSTSNFNGNRKAGDIVTFTCKASGKKLYSICEPDGKWSSPTGSC